jgi:hypothetical protein
LYFFLPFVYNCVVKVTISFFLKLWHYSYGVFGDMEQDDDFRQEVRSTCLKLQALISNGSQDAKLKGTLGTLGAVVSERGVQLSAGGFFDLRRSSLTGVSTLDPIQYESKSGMNTLTRAYLSNSLYFHSDL